jgi:hypothetical protein
MTPDDMEAVARERLKANLRGHDAVFAMRTGKALEVLDVYAEDLRALLLAYQERGRALERIAATRLLNDGGAQRRLGQVVTEARATLKGKSHD